MLKGETQDRETGGVGGVRSGGEFGNLSALIKLNISGGGVGIAP
jgi:hypothetical protein